MGGKVKNCGQSRKYKAGKGGKVILRPLQFPRWAAQRSLRWHQLHQAKILHLGLSYANTIQRNFRLSSHINQIYYHCRVPIRYYTPCSIYHGTQVERTDSRNRRGETWERGEMEKTEVIWQTGETVETRESGIAGQRYESCRNDKFRHWRDRHSWKSARTLQTRPCYF